MPSIGKYNHTYFDNHPEEKDKEGVLYGIVLVNKQTFKRECVKVGIASGKDWRHIIKRSRGFKGFKNRKGEKTKSYYKKLRERKI